MEQAFEYLRIRISETQMCLYSLESNWFFIGGLRTNIPAQMAAAGPPLGTQLGQLGVNIANFVKDFNLRTSIYR